MDYTCMTKYLIITPRDYTQYAICCNTYLCFKYLYYTNSPFSGVLFCQHNYSFMSCENKFLKTLTELEIGFIIIKLQLHNY